MHIDVLANNTVKITLNRIDMNAYEINFDSLSQKNPDTKRLLVELLAIIRMEKNLDLSEGRLFIEAFPRNDGGCMLYISCLEKLSEKPSREGKAMKPKKTSDKETSVKSQVICEVDSLDILTKLCVHLSTIDSEFKSSIYHYDNYYRVILQDENDIDDHVFRIIKEYGRVIGISEVSAAKTKEHFEAIAVGTGVETIVKTLGKHRK